MLITKLFTYFITPTAFYSSLGIFLPVSDGQGQLGHICHLFYYETCPVS